MTAILLGVQLLDIPGTWEARENCRIVTRLIPRLRGKERETIDFRSHRTFSGMERGKRGRRSRGKNRRPRFIVGGFRME